MEGNRKKNRLKILKEGLCPSMLLYDRHQVYHQCMLTSNTGTNNLNRQLGKTDSHWAPVMVSIDVNSILLCAND